MISAISFKTQQPNNTKTQKKKNNPYLPLQAALLSTAIWTGVGFGIDYLVINKLFKSGSGDKKLSVIINTLFGFIMGLSTFFSVRKKQREENLQSLGELTKGITA